MKARLHLTPMASGRWMAKVTHHGKLMAGSIHPTQARALAGGAEYAAALTSVEEIEVVVEPLKLSEDGAMAAANP